VASTLTKLLLAFPIVSAAQNGVRNYLTAWLPPTILPVVLFTEPFGDTETVTSIQIPDLNCAFHVSAARITANGYVYVDSGDPEYEETSYWVSLPTFKNYLVSHPEFYLTGFSGGLKLRSRGQ